MKSAIAANGTSQAGEFAVQSNAEFIDEKREKAWRLFYESYEEHKVYFDQILVDLNMTLEIDDNMYYFIDQDFTPDSE